MVQDIITYMILGSAITLALVKAKNKFWRRKRKSGKAVSETGKFASQHNCSSCSAECVLRDSFSPNRKYHIDVCSATLNKSEKHN